MSRTADVPTAGTGTGRRARRRVLVVLGAAGVATVAGLAATLAMVGPSSHRAGEGAGGGGPVAAVGQTVRTSFGFVTVNHVDHLKGLSQQDLSSANHGVNGLVESGKEQVQVTVELTSDLARETAPYSPEDFTLDAVDGAGATLVFAPVTTTVHAGRLQPFAAVTGHLGFVVPADGRQLRLRFQDPGGEPVVIALDRAGVDAAQPGHTEAAGSHP